MVNLREKLTEALAAMNLTEDEIQDVRESLEIAIMGANSMTVLLERIRRKCKRAGAPQGETHVCLD